MLERPVQRLSRIDASVLWLVAALAQVFDEEGGVALGVFNKEQAKRPH